MQFAGWAGINIEGQISITEAGLRIVRGPDEIRKLRLQLADLMLKARPPWLNLFPRGREEAIPYLPATVQQCLREAELTNGETAAVVEWWDTFADVARADERSALTLIGREGERRSLAFEDARTGVRPHWKALYSNNAGYDILSRISSTDVGPLCVEVKATKQRLEEARFFITVNEWHTATSSTNYVFHLWALEIWDKPRIVSIQEMEAHIPNNAGRGEWQLIVIPFAVFEAGSQAVSDIMVIS